MDTPLGNVCYVGPQNTEKYILKYLRELYRVIFTFLQLFWCLVFSSCVYAYIPGPPPSNDIIRAYSIKLIIRIFPFSQASFSYVLAPVVNVLMPQIMP